MAAASDHRTCQRDGLSPGFRGMTGVEWGVVEAPGLRPPRHFSRGKAQTMEGSQDEAPIAEVTKVRETAERLAYGESADGGDQIRVVAGLIHNSPPRWRSSRAVGPAVERRRSAVWARSLHGHVLWAALGWSTLLVPLLLVAMWWATGMYDEHQWRSDQEQQGEEDTLSGPVGSEAGSERRLFDDLSSERGTADRIPHPPLPMRAS